MDRMNFEPLTPTSFLRRAGEVFQDRVAVIDGDRRTTYGELLARALRLAGALRGLGATDGARVAAICGNSQAMLELHYGAPFAGAVLLPLNVRLTPEDLAWCIQHAGAKVLVHDAPNEATAIEVERRVPGLRRIGPSDYEALVESGQPFSAPVQDELGLLALSYTSGTTAKPKGIMYHHRGAYLQSLAMALEMKLDAESRYLWTLPMFHCDGWCFTWAVTAVGGTHICLPAIDAAKIWRLFREAGVTHMCGAPTVLSMLLFHPDAKKDRPVRYGIGGAAPTPVVLARAAELGIDVTHLYGLTETFGPIMLCKWRSEWNGLPIEEQARLKSRQGVGNVISGRARIVGSDGGDVPADGATMGEVALRGNNIMLGYYKDDEATQRAAPDGWFRSGDLGVMHPDGYVELKDRAKDIIISGGENVSSLEVESALSAHPAVLEAAVVAGPDEKWGEVPIAFVKLKPGQDVSGPALIEHARTLLAKWKAPKRVVFGDIPRTSTGKVQKLVLRERARALVNEAKDKEGAR